MLNNKRKCVIHEITTIKCQFLRGQLLIISCILRVQYLCHRFMHLYFTPWPKKDVKPLSYTGEDLFLKCMWSFSEIYCQKFQSFWNAIFCTSKLHLGVTAISTSVSAVVFLLVGLAGWYNLNINCNQNIHYTNKLSYLHFLGSCVGGRGIFFTYLPSFTQT